MTPCNFSISIIRPRSCSFSASYTALSLLRSLDLSLASILGKTIAKFLDTQISRFQIGYSDFKLSKQVNFYKHSTHSNVTRQVVGVFTVQTPHSCLQDLLPTSACRDILSISKHVISGNHLTSHLHPMTSQSTCHTSETKTRLIWIENTQALRCPWLYIRNVPT